MGTNDLFHPDHAVPVLELIAAAGKVGNRGKSQFLMKLLAVSGKVGILFLWEGNAGIEVGKAHFFQKRFHLLIEEPTHTAAAGILVQIDGQLTAPLIGGSGVEGRGVAVPHDNPLIFDHKVGVALSGVLDPLCKFL